MERQATPEAVGYCDGEINGILKWLCSTASEDVIEQVESQGREERDV